MKIKKPIHKLKYINGIWKCQDFNCDFEQKPIIIYNFSNLSNKEVLERYEKKGVEK